MTIDWDQIKLDVATAMANALAAAQASAFAAFPMPYSQIQATYTWDGTDTVTTGDTSEVTEGDPVGPPVVSPSYIKLGEDGDWYKVIAIVTDTSIQVEDTYGVGSFPSGAGASFLSDGPVPDAPSSDSLDTKLATPIAVAVIDGVKAALDQAEIHDVADDPGNTVGPGVIV